MLLPIFLMLQVVLMGPYNPSSHCSHISQLHPSRIPREVHTATPLHNCTEHKLEPHLPRPLVPQRPLLRPPHRRPSAARTVAGTMRPQSLADAHLADLLTSLR